MIFIILGSQGSGKTIFMSREGYQAAQKGMTIYSNYKLNYPHKILTFEDMLRCKLNNAMVLVDEAALYGFGSRDFGSKKNKIISGQFLVQCRKQNVLLYCSAQWYMLLETRLRNMCDYVVHCKKFIYNPDSKTLHDAVQSKNYPKSVKTIIQCEWNDMDQNKTAYQYFFANDYYDLYDTSEVIQLQEMPEDYENGQETKEAD